MIVRSWRGYAATEKRDACPAHFCRAVLRHARFDAEDHVRYYGLDFADRLAQVGFTVTTFRLPPEQEVRYGLLRDEWLYAPTKPPRCILSRCAGEAAGRLPTAGAGDACRLPSNHSK